ncbi:DUF6292 domain-containing protein [Kibdelosporangium persicum]|uniref:DUF6292 domain-containing protein n=1 Tax=Kibdelosporangium persicum TaxID=2698649 RepID=A0ABX2F9V9_9PSEU|nr:DUF6292 family protein [Kibdelosporangium persicum]NRN67573.1 hypothetical protein [Kibdelosporangium persicum]
MIDELRDYLTAVTAHLGVGLESCCWGSDAPAWAYVALDWRLSGRDVALVWDAESGWSIATEPDIGRDLDVVARLDGEVTPEPAAVADFVATLRSAVRQPPSAGSAVPTTVSPVTVSTTTAA